MRWLISHGVVLHQIAFARIVTIAHIRIQFVGAGERLLVLLMRLIGRNALALGMNREPLGLGLLPLS
ncbi:MAG: hypothetical protein ABI137_15705, partial [Antricoccus sp.]